jgi:acyl-CoA synthetase (AMP-forming)/AMP-acid ligase II
MYRKAARSAAVVCLHFAGRDITYAEVFSEANAVARGLGRIHGVRVGDRVAVILPNCPQWWIAFVAITSMGAVAVLVDPRGEPSHIRNALQLARCSVVITDESTGRMLAEHADSRPQMLVRNCTGESHLEPLHASFAGTAREDAHLPIDRRALDPDQEALVAFTTGSTSFPKGVVSSHRAVVAGVMNMMLSSALASIRNRAQGPVTQRVQGSPSSLLLAPLTHVSGYSHLLLMTQVVGKVVLLPTWQVETAVDLIENQRIRALSGANAAQLRELIRREARLGLDSLTSVGIHGEALRENILAELRDRLPNATPGTGYGLTETNGSICAAVGRDLAEHPGTCGPVVPAVEARILDEHGVAVPTGETGEIWVRGAMLMSGYCGRSTASDTGWFCTEDFGRIDAQGWLFLAQRRQDVFYCGDQPLSVAAIERLAYECGGIDEAAALFSGEGQRLHRLVVAIVPRKGAVDPGPQLSARLTRELGADACQVQIETLAQLPRLSSGKIDRRTLRERFAAH